MGFLSVFGDARHFVVLLSSAKFFLVILIALMTSSCVSLPNNKTEPEVIVQSTPHEPEAVYPKGRPMPTITIERLGNNDDLLRQQSAIDKIMSFLKDQITSGEARTLPTRAADVLNVNFRFVANKAASEGKDITDFLIDQTDIGNGQPYREGRVDVYEGGQIPDTIYSTFYEIYSEGDVPKYIDLFIKYSTRNGGVCLSSIEYADAALAQGLKPRGGLSRGYLLVLFFHAEKKSALVQADDNGERCARKLGLRIKY